MELINRAIKYFPPTLKNTYAKYQDDPSAYVNEKLAQMVMPVISFGDPITS